MAVIGNNTAGRALPNISFFGSQSWTPAYTLQAYVYVIGGGGSGGVLAKITEELLVGEQEDVLFLF